MCAASTSSLHISPWRDLDGRGTQGLKYLENNLRFHHLNTKHGKLLLVTNKTLADFGIQIRAYLTEEASGKKWSIHICKTDESLPDSHITNAKDITFLFLFNKTRLPIEILDKPFIISKRFKEEKEDLKIEEL